MGGFLSTTYNCPVTDYYGSDWMKGDLSITVDGSGNGSFSLKMTNNWGGTGKCSGSLVLYINGTKMHDLYYNASYTPSASSGTNPSWTTGFPIQNNSSMSGTFSVGTAASFTVHYAVCRSQSAVTYSNSNRLTDGTASVYGTYAFTFTRTTWSDISKGTVSITDNGNNTFKISGTSGSGGTNNATTGWSLDYGYDTNYGTAASNGTSYNLAGTAASRVVYARCTTTATRGSSAVATTSKTIYRYAAPGDVGKPALSTSSFRNGRLTVKQNWTYTWTAASAGTTNSPVLGYRIRMYKNGSLVKGITAGSGSNISKGTGTNEYLDRSGSTNCSITFNPVSFGFEPGDTIYIGVFAWAANGAGSTLWSGGGSTHVTSDVTTVQNSGIMRVRPAGSWKEGVVSVKVDDKWIEADVVQIKADGKWKESE